MQCLVKMVSHFPIHICFDGNHENQVYSWSFDNYENFPFRDRLTAGRETLNLLIMVRIHVSEPSRPVPTDRDRG